MRTILTALSATPVGLVLQLSPAQGSTLTLESFTPRTFVGGQVELGPSTPDSVITDSDGIEGQVVAEATIGIASAFADVGSGILRSFSTKRAEDQTVSGSSSIDLLFRYDGATELVLPFGSFGFATNARLQWASGFATSVGSSSLNAIWLSQETENVPEEVGGRWTDSRICFTRPYGTDCVAEVELESSTGENVRSTERTYGGPNDFNYEFSTQSPEITLLPGNTLGISMLFYTQANNSGAFFSQGEALADGSSGQFYFNLPSSVDFSLGAFTDEFPDGVSFLRSGEAEIPPIPLPASIWMLVISVFGLGVLSKIRTA